MAYTDIANVSAYLQTTIDGTTTPASTTVQVWIDEACDEIDRITKSSFESNVVTDQIISTDSDTGIISATSFDGTGAYNQPAPQDMIAIPNKKILTLTAAAYNTASDGETPVWVDLDLGYGSDCVLVGDNISILTPGLIIPRKKTGMKISYTHGNSSVPGFVQKMATRMVALDFINSGLSEEVSGGGGSIRVGDIQITESGRFTQDYVESTQEWIDLKLRQLGTNNVYLI